MAASVARTWARGLIGLAGLGMAGSALASDAVAGAIFGAGAGAIIGHAIGGPEAAAAGGVIGAVTGAAATSHGRGPGVAVHFSPGYVYGPPRIYHRPPVYVAPPPVMYLPHGGHGFWHHGVDAWGRPFRTWVPAHPPRFRPDHAIPPYHHHHRGHRHDHRHGPRHSHRR